MTDQDYMKLSEILFPHVTQTVDDVLKLYPPRGVPAVRFAPSPTGYLHIGNLMTCNIVSRVAKSVGGKYILRIEDTDQKREVTGATEYLIQALKNFDIIFDEGFDGKKNFGDYGPYVQSKRLHLYHVFAKRMVQLGRAYPCFCTTTELNGLRQKQETQKVKTGYYGTHAICKNLSIEEIEKKINKGEKWALRFDTGDMENKRIEWNDLIKGKMSLPAEINNPVIIKSDGIPPYNFAHVIDDTLMRVSHITRGDEWLVSTAEHIQIYDALELGTTRYEYAHLPALCVEDNGSKRKISKRKDKAALVQNFLDDGYPKGAILEYLLTLSNSNFELWRIQNPNISINEFEATIDKIGSNSPLFDWNKLNDISKNVISKMTCREINDAVREHFKNRTDEQSKNINANLDKVYAVLAIDRETEKPRKDIVKLSDIYPLYSYLFESGECIIDNKETVDAYKKVFNKDDTKEEWFERIKKLCRDMGYADSVKDYKKNPEAFKGHVGNVTQAIRLAVTGRENTPDLYQILSILSEKTVLERLSK